MAFIHPIQPATIHDKTTKLHQAFALFEESQEAIIASPLLAPVITNHTASLDSSLAHRLAFQEARAARYQIFRAKAELGGSVDDV